MMNFSYWNLAETENYSELNQHSYNISQNSYSIIKYWNGKVVAGQQPNKDQSLNGMEG